MHGWARKLVLTLLLLAGGVMALAVVSWWRLDRFLGSDACRRLAGDALAKSLGMHGEFMPFARAAGSVYSEGFMAQGAPEVPLGRVRADQLRADINVRSLFGQALRVENVSAQRLLMEFQTPAVADAPHVEVSVSSRGARPLGALVLPRRVEVGQVVVQAMDLRWPSGASSTGQIAGVRVRAAPAHGVWQVDASGGTVRQPGLPVVEVERVAGRLNDRTLFLTEARLRCGDTGRIVASGDASGGANPRIEVDGEFHDVPVVELVPGDWRARVRGAADGSFTWRRVPGTAGSEVRGKAVVTGGRLEALPILDQIATFTKTEQFRSLKLDAASAEFLWTSDGLRVTNVVIEARGYLRVEGAFTVAENGALSGRLEVGTTSERLAAIPGAEAKVFTASRGGYVWAQPAVTLSGTRADPREDLSPRLGGAAVEVLSDTVKDAVKQAPDKARDVIRGGVQLLDGFLR